MRLSSTADPLPTRFLARRIRLSAGSAKRVHSIDIARLFGVEETIFGGGNGFFRCRQRKTQTTRSRRNMAISVAS
jgi:hypothetical protein